MRTIWKIFSFILIASIVISALALTVGKAQARQDGPISICHRTDSNTNPYVGNTVDVDSIIKNNGHDSHDGPIWFEGIVGKWGDIIPEFWWLKADKNSVVFTNPGDPTLWDHYAGKNWPDGQSILNNGCTVPTPPPPPPPKDASVSVTPPSECVKPGETATVTFTVSHATLTLNGVGYTADGSVELPAGNYSWSAVADEGYTLKGDSSGTFTITTCEQKDASVSVNVDPGCVKAGETKTVNFTVSHATLTLNGVDYTADGSVELGAGNYSWSAVADDGYTLTGPSSGSFTIASCGQDTAQVSVTPPGTCVKEGETATVTFTVSHATLTLNGADYTADGSVELPAGNYSWSAVADEGYVLIGDSSGTFTISTCENPPKPGSVSITIVRCYFDEDKGSSLIVVDVQVDHAVLHGLPGGDITTNVTLILPPGTYPYSWEAISPYTGSGKGKLVLNTSCTPAHAIYVPKCPTCYDTNGIWWETPSGNPGWQSTKVDGPLADGVELVVGTDNCDIYGGRCHLTQWLMLLYNADKVKGKVELIDNGVNWKLPDPHLGVDGQHWVFYYGRVCEWAGSKELGQQKAADAMKARTLCHSSNDAQVYIDGVLQYPWVYKDKAPNNRLYNYWPCSLAPSAGMTYQNKDGKWVIQWLPLFTTFDMVIWQLKMGMQPWPKGWPTDTHQHSWIWGVDPLKAARSWANACRAEGQFHECLLPPINK